MAVVGLSVVGVAVEGDAVEGTAVVGAGVGAGLGLSVGRTGVGGDAVEGVAVEGTAVVGAGIANVGLSVGVAVMGPAEGEEEEGASLEFVVAPPASITPAGAPPFVSASRSPSASPTESAATVTTTAMIFTDVVEVHVIRVDEDFIVSGGE